MFGTIEPRLIALLNDDSRSHGNYPHFDLPPLHEPDASRNAGGLHLLEPDASTRAVPHLLPSSSGSPIPLTQSAEPKSKLKIGTSDVLSKEPLSTKRSHEAHCTQSCQATPNHAGVDLKSDKRERPLVESKEDFMQLPKPPKKQKTAKQAVPPIIIGLHEPPPNAALFPPIASSSFHDSHGRNSLNATSDTKIKDSLPTDSCLDRSSEKTRKTTSGSQTILSNMYQTSRGSPRKKSLETRRSSTHRTISKPCKARPDKRSQGFAGLTTKTRNKWSVEETEYLLLGVKLYGIGSWTRILNDSNLRFSGRRAVDLKDRFRTCCPGELRNLRVEAKAVHLDRSVLPNRNTDSPRSIVESPVVRKTCVEDNVYKVVDEALRSKGRAHRIDKTDLARLGIHEPFTKSTRRARNPFSDKEDGDILLGLQEYGPQWSLIQKDPRFQFQDRRPTDLRDRLRNKFPEKYLLTEGHKANMIEWARSSGKGLAGQASCEVFVVNQISQEREVDCSQTLIDGVSTRVTNTGYMSFSDLLGPPTAFEAVDNLSDTHLYEWPESSNAFTNTIGDMDITRLIIDGS